MTLVSESYFDKVLVHANWKTAELHKNIHNILLLKNILLKNSSGNGNKKLTYLLGMK